MSFWSKLFAKVKADSMIAIDIGADSVGGAYLYFGQNQLPTMLYGKRIPIYSDVPASPFDGIQKALNVLGNALLKEGAPLLFRTSGSGRAGSVLVSLDAPWQETIVRSEKIEREKPFVFTKSILQAALARSAEVPPERLLADESVVGTILDGWGTKDPFGRRATYVNIVTLASSIDRGAAKIIHDEIRRLFHYEEVRIIAAPSLRYQILRTLFPHEEDYLVVDSMGPALAVSLVRHGLLVAVEQSKLGGSDTDPWISAIKHALESITKRFPLPRTIFLIAKEEDRANLKVKLESGILSGLLLTQEQPSVIPLTPSHLTDRVKLMESASADLPLEMMAAFVGELSTHG